MYIDNHIHLVQFEEKEREKLMRLLKDFTFLAVSEDYLESIKTVNLSIKYNNVIPAIGLHPWEIKKEIDIKDFEKLIEKFKIPVLGEISLDKKFVPETFEIQKKVFERFLSLAENYDLALNLHCPDAWRECFNLVTKYNIRKVYFHWYTGPLDLLREIESQNYFIGINVAMFKQEKHKRILENAPLKIIITESDAPWKYKGESLTPTKIPELVKLIAETKDLEERAVIDKIRKNFRKFIY